jgi:glycosyltransferase involved in cell wall biosynthesis
MKATYSVIIPAYNAERFIGECIDSVLDDLPTEGEETEIVVVDDGSTDLTANIVGQRKGVRLYRHEKRSGQAAAINTGISATTGDYIFLIDADDKWIKGRFSASLSHMVKNKAHLAYGGRVIWDEQSDLTVEDPARRVDLSSLLFYNDITRSTVCFHRSLIHSIGGFDTSVSGSDDWDFWVRASQRFNVCAIPSRLAKYRVHENNISTTRKNKMHHYATTRTAIQQKYLFSQMGIRKWISWCLIKISQLEVGICSRKITSSVWRYRLHKVINSVLSISHRILVRAWASV